MTSPVVAFQRIVPYYRVPVFRRLWSECGIIVCHSRERRGASLSSCHDQFDYENMLLGRFFFLPRDTAVVQNVIRPLAKYRPKIVISEYAVGYLSFWLLLLFRKVFGYRLAVWTHGVRNEDILKPFESKRGSIDRYVFATADAVLFYSDSRRRLTQTVIDVQQKSFVAPNTLDTEQLFVVHRALAKRGRVEVRKAFGWREEYHLIYVGRLIASKRVDVLLAAFAQVRTRLNAALHVIGDGPEVSRLDDAPAGTYYHGEVLDNRRLGEFLFASDLLLNPGPIGLAIIHAFCFGLPVITCSTGSDGPFHGPEAEHLVDGLNGCLSACDPTAIASVTSAVLQDATRLNEMRAAAIESAQRNSIQSMVGGFRALINYLDEA